MQQWWKSILIGSCSSEIYKKNSTAYCHSKGYAPNDSKFVIVLEQFDNFVWRKRSFLQDLSIFFFFV
jgi:hypothetical protein